jgi:hypothetical protein
MHSVLKAFHRATSSRSDWIFLNRLLGDNVRMLVWFDGVKEDNALQVVFEYLIPLPSILEQEGRWRDLGGLYRKPLDRLRHDFYHRNDMLSGHNDSGHADELGRAHFRERARILYKSLLAADRHTEAAAVAGAARQLDPSAEMRQALDAEFQQKQR